MAQDDNSNWYSKLAKSGWLGTKAQVSAQYGQPAWGDDSSGDAQTQAIKNLAQKKPAATDSGS